MNTRRNFIKKTPLLAAGAAGQRLNLSASSQKSMAPGNETIIANEYFQAKIRAIKNKINVTLDDLRQKAVWADGIYIYQLAELVDGKTIEYDSLELAKVGLQTDHIRTRGLIGGFEIEHNLVDADR